MGNPDLIIIINGIAIIVKGTDYDNEDQAIGIAIAKYRAYAQKETADYYKAKEENPEMIFECFNPEETYRIKSITISDRTL